MAPHGAGTEKEVKLLTDGGKRKDLNYPQSGTKWVKCDCGSCGERRIHHEEPTTLRGAIIFEAPIEHPGPFFCSIECFQYWQAAQVAEQNSEEIRRRRATYGMGSSKLCECGHDTLWEHKHEKGLRFCLVRGCDCKKQFAA